MANVAPPYSTYVNTAENKRVITDYIALLDPSDAPFIEAIGGLDGAASKFRFTNQGTLVEWIEDTLAPLTGVFALTATANSATNVTSLKVADGNMVQPGHILLSGTELLWVSANSNGVLTVTRSLGNSTMVTLATDASFSIVGMARLEGADSDPIGYTDLSTNSNYTQIFHKEIKQTGTAPYQDRWGMTDQMQYESAKSIPEMMRLIERTLQYGKRSAGSTTTPRMMGGYQEFITTNKASGANMSVSSLIPGIIEDAVELIYNAGGAGDFLAIVNPATYQKIKNAYDSSSYVRYAPEQNRFGTLVDRIVTPFGDVSFVIDRWQLSNLIPILKLDNVGMLTLRPWQVEDLAKTGDAEKKQLVGEYTFCLKLEKSHALLTAVA
ncbi:MAG: hypothetical protein BWY95_01624 [Bacteroidetes bacterium ADurb.BinA104]|nr:MAG: hypothetical protein BWY95_01624 [Bacteroidetes bacterium ADurb.BinA104]